MEYQIGQFSKLTSLSVKTLRHYDDIGLLTPARIDQVSSYRYYNEQQLERAAIIGRLKYFEFSLQEITEIISGAEDDTDIIHHLHQRAQKVEALAQKYSALSTELSTLISINREDSMETTSEITVKEVPAINIISIRYKGKYSDIGTYIKTLYRAAGMHVAGKPFALYYDEGYEEIADIEVCLPVKKEIDKDSVSYRTLPGGTVHSYMHIGPYTTITESYKKLVDYIQKRNIQITTPSREIYIKAPGMIFKGNPQKYRTEIQMMEK